MMFPGDLIRLAFQNLSLHKVRSALTSLGVIFGVGSVIAMLAISEGAKRKALAEIEAMGIDKIILFSKPPSVESQDNNKNSQRKDDSPSGLSGYDRMNVAKMENVKRVTPMQVLDLPIMKGLQRLDLKMMGVDFNFLQDSGSLMYMGRWFSPADYRNMTNVCVLGSNAKRKLFALSSRDVIGTFIQVFNQPYRVIGVLENQIGTKYNGVSPNDMICIPLSLGTGLYATLDAQGGNMSYFAFIVQVEEVEFIDNTSRRLNAYFDQTHKDRNDWGIVVPLELLKQMESTQDIFTIVMSSIASISLIVGGIGIMNIMLAGVYERRKEIGTRRALGAQKSDILWQFLLETVFLTTLGGLLGIGMGIGLSQVIAVYAAMPVIYSWWSIVLSLFISCFVGVVFGTYPAWKAAQQNPIDVLRSE